MSQFGLIPEAEDEVVEAEPSARPRRRRRRHSSWLAVIVSVAVIGGLGAAVVIAGQGLLSRAGDLLTSGPQDYPGPGPGTTVPIVVDEGDSASDIALTLTAEDVVASAEAFVDVAARDAASTGIQPGTYEMPQQIPAADALSILVDPSNRISDAVLVREGLRVEQTIDAFVEQAGLGPKKLRNALNRPQAIGLPPEAAGEPEGFLFPATYEVEPSTTEVEAMGAMTAKYRAVAEDLDMEARAEALGYTPREIVTVASIIQGEARLPEDFPKVAAVIYNRLDDGEVLAMDSTVAYANDVYTVFTTDEQRAIDSPYNTYRFAGLPPGPINSPGEQALQAALNPADVGFRYFVTVDLDTGEMEYAETLAEHERNVARAQADGFGQENES
jgi:UPF0755 protein